MRRKTKIKVKAIALVLAGFTVFGAGCSLKLEPPGSDNDTPDLPPVELTYWSVFNNSEDIQPVIDAYQELNPNVSIEYKKLEITEYETELVSALAEDRGPDIFSYHMSWRPKYESKLEPISIDDAVLSDFVPVVGDAAVGADSQVYGLPYSVDTLALYYNPKLLSSAGIPTPPTTWEEFDEAVKKLVILDEGRNFLREGGAIGTVNNVNRGIDALLLLMLQNGTEMTNTQNTEATFANSAVQDNGQRYSPGVAALNKYLDYANPTSTTYTWNRDLPIAFDEFKNGKLGMVLNYAYSRERLQGDQEIRVAEAPQLSGAPTPINYASFWLEGVAKKSENQLEAWKFILFATGVDGGQIFTDNTGLPSARYDILTAQETNRDLLPFANQAVTAQTWYQKDAIATETVLKDMVASIFEGKRTPENALQLAETQVTNIMKQ